MASFLKSSCLFERWSYTGRENLKESERDLPSTDSLPKWPPKWWTRLNPVTWKCVQVFHVAAGAQLPRPSFNYFLGALAGSVLETGQLELELALTWAAGVADGCLTHCATMPCLAIFSYNFFPCAISTRM